MKLLGMLKTMTEKHAAKVNAKLAKQNANQEQVDEAESVKKEIAEWEKKMKKAGEAESVKKEIAE